MRPIFYDDEMLVKYEQQEQWDKCVEHLNKMMSLNEENKFILYRLAAQSWYVLTFWDCNMPKDRLNRTLFEESFKHAYFIAKEKCWNDSNCLWLFGYFMYINQWDFSHIDTDVGDIEQEGNRLIIKAYEKDSNNLLAEILYLADSGKWNTYMMAKKKIKKHINIYFPHRSAIEQYFTEVFTNGV